MAIRKSIEFSVSKTGISPSTYQNIGIQSDHNVSEVVFNLDQDLYHSLTENAIGDILYRFDGYTASGEMKSSEYYHLSFENTPLIYSVSEWLTHSGGDVKVVLVITDISNGKTHFEFNAPPALLRFSYKPESVGEASESVESLTTLARNAEIAANLAEAAAESADVSNVSAVASAASAFESARTAKMEAEVAASYSISAGEFSDDAVMSADKARASEESAAESERIANEHRISAENASASASESKEKAEAAANKAESIVGEIGILNSASGESILLTDSTENEFKGLKVYGKSTQDGTPTPEAPIPIVSAGASGSVEVKVCGANLIDTIAGKKIGETISADGGSINDDDYSTSVFFELPCYGSERCLTWTATHTAKYSLYLRFFDEHKNVIKTTKPVFCNTNTTNVKSNTTVPSNAKYYCIAGAIGNTCTCSEFMLNIGSTALPYEPYTEQALTLATPNELRAVGSYADYIDLEKGVLVQRTKKVNLGDYIWDGAWDKHYNIEGTFIGNCNKFGDNTIFFGGQKCLMTHLPNVKTILTSAEIGWNNAQGGGSCLGIRVPTSIASNVTELKNWLAENNVQYIYQLAEPIETPLTAEELAYYKALHTNYPNTTIFNSDGTNMDVSYIADTKLYIDNKFAELQALALGV